MDKAMKILCTCLCAVILPLLTVSCIYLPVCCSENGESRTSHFHNCAGGSQTHEQLSRKYIYTGVMASLPAAAASFSHSRAGGCRA